jgi:hypothetical protein
VTGERAKHGPAGRPGQDRVIAVQDERSRLVYAELHGAENTTRV